MYVANNVNKQNDKQTDRQTDRQADGLENPTTPTDIVGVESNIIYRSTFTLNTYMIVYHNATIITTNSAEH